MVNTGTRFFGYGSLVNLATHGYLNPRKTTVAGWRRQWVHSQARDVSFLSATKDPQSSIQGMIADVTGIGWDALDLRESGYDRHALNPIELQTDSTGTVQIYVANAPLVDHAGHGKPILLSYLDCVIQGFLEHFGEQGVAAFFNSTSGWERAVKDDRKNPIYPRAQALSKRETLLVDQNLDRLSVVITA